MNLYVSNLTYVLTDDELRGAFEAYGTVSSARVVMDRETGRSRGFGFVEMPNEDEGAAALVGMNGADLGGRPVKVVIARPKEERPGGFGGGGNAGSGAGRRDGGGGRRDGGGGGRDWGGGGGGGRRDGGGREKDRNWERERRGGGGRSGGSYRGGVGDDEGW
jgi:RNA recognition motif-containing protein